MEGKGSHEDAKNRPKGTREVGQLSATAVQIGQKPCHLCYPECSKSIMDKIKYCFCPVKLLHVSVTTTCLKFGLVGIDKF